MPKKTKEINKEENIEKEATKKDVKRTTNKKTTKTNASSKASTKKSAEKIATKNTDKNKKATKATTTDKKTSKIASSAKTSVKGKTTTINENNEITSTAIPMAVEYYDLPYKYNETVVKVLYQNPTTLFVYWEISDNDIENYKKIYGDNFFETTEPILTVFNDTLNYKFEIVINDYANSWYFNINDSKCHYHVELGRRPKNYYTLEENYVYITSSNVIESPNDKILFSTNDNNSIYFKNTKNNTYRKIELPNIISKLNLNNKKVGFPLIKNFPDLYGQVFKVENVSDFNQISNPSSGNPSSGSLSSRFN